MSNNEIKRNPIPKILLFLTIVFFGVVYIFYTWIQFNKDKSDQVLQIARSIEVLLPKEDIKILEAKAGDVYKPEYQTIKNILKAVIRVNNKARFAYLFAEQNEKIFFIADSEPENSQDYSPPGQEYTEAKPIDMQPFITGKELVTTPLSDRWGTWISVYIPVKDEVTGKIIAVFGMDFNAKLWDSLLLLALVKSSVLIILLLLTFFFLVQIRAHNRSLKSVISERKQLDEALSNSEIRMRSITDSAQDAILMMDPEGLISYWNPAAERIFGYTNSEAIGQNLHSFIVPKLYHEAHNAAFSVFKKTGSGYAVGKSLDLEALRKDGTEISVQLSLSAIQINNGWHSVGVLREITEQKKIAAALLKAKEESEMANKAKSIFLSNMSHEIRTPLNAIIGFSQLMSRDKQLTALQKEYNVSIINAGEHLLELINEILELSKIEAGRVVLNPTSIDLHSFSDDINLIFKEQARSKHLQLLFETADDLPKYVVIDESKLRQIFVNLIGNAIKFTDEGGIAVRIRVEKNIDGPYNLIAEIQDSGPGIPEDELDKLFKHFVQTSSGIKKGTGTGLGLALSRELALLMGGDITVSSIVGQGSIFTFHVEIKEGEMETVEKNIAKRVIFIDKGEESYRILVVDDKKENLQVVVNLLKLVGFETFEAVNGKKAIEMFEECKPHLILMDMRMPVMDGYEATLKIKSMERGKQTPIIALTASTFEEEKSKIEALDMQGYIRKPFKESELFSTIGKAIGIKYIYEEELPLSQKNNLKEIEINSQNISKLTNSLILQMLDAISTADLDQLLILINSIEPDNPELAKHLMTLAKNYDYNHLQEILNEKEKTNE